jgi:hypothetical protein
MILWSADSLAPIAEIRITCPTPACRAASIAAFSLRPAHTGSEVGAGNDEQPIEAVVRADERRWLIGVTRPALDRGRNALGRPRHADQMVVPAALEQDLQDLASRPASCPTDIDFHCDNLSIVANKTLV